MATNQGSCCSNLCRSTYTLSNSSAFSLSEISVFRELASGSAWYSLSMEISCEACSSYEPHGARARLRVQGNAAIRAQLSQAGGCSTFRIAAFQTGGGLNELAFPPHRELHDVARLVIVQHGNEARHAI